MNVNRQQLDEPWDGWGRWLMEPFTEAKNLTMNEMDHFKNPPKKFPELSNYTGWDRMQCDATQTVKYVSTPWHDLKRSAQGWLFTGLAVTAGLPLLVLNAVL